MKNYFGVEPQVMVLAIARMAESIGNSFLIVVLPLYIATEHVTGSSVAGFDLILIGISILLGAAVLMRTGTGYWILLLVPALIGAILVLDSLGLTLTEVAITGIILSLSGFVSSPLQPYTGRLSDRLARRKIFVLFGLLVLGIASGSYAFATNYWHLGALRILQGVAAAFIIPSTIALVNDLTIPENRGGNMGTYNTFRLVGFGAGPVAAGILVEAGPYTISVGARELFITGYDGAFYLAAVTALISFLLVLLFIRDPDIEPQEDHSTGLNIAVLDRERDKLLDPVFTLGIVSFFMAVGIALFATLGDLINARLGQGEGWFGLQFAAFVFAQVALQAPIGRATDFYGRKRFIVLGTALLVPTTLVQGIVLDSLLMFVARFLQGIAGAMVFAPALALAGDLAPDGRSGSTLSVLTMSFGFGVAVGPFMSGFLVDLGFIVPFAFGSALALIGVVLVQTQVDETIEPTELNLSSWLP